MVALSAAMAVGAAGCAASKRGSDSGGSSGKTLVFGTAGEPKLLDPAMATDGESFRVSRQVLETLLQPEDGGTKIVGGLAESWDTSPDGKTWTFHLRKGVKFHDGTDFNAAAVCFNFDRWFNWKGINQNESVSSYWQDTFGGFAHNESADAPPPNYKSCTAKDDATVVMEFDHASSRLPGGFTLPSFSIQSPTALKDGNADAVGGDANALQDPQYALTKAVGTGPFKLVGWDRTNKTVTMERFDGYWGAKAKVKKLVFKAIPDENARRQALEANEIQGYDLVAPADVTKLKGEGFNVPTREPFNLLYLGMRQGTSKLADIRVRQAIAYAVNRQALVQSKLPPGAKVATQFMPDNIEGYNPNITTTYNYDPAKAKSLLAAAGATNLTLKFYYPTEVTRPYMPNPKDIFEIVKSDLEAAGIKVTPVPAKWSRDYLDAVDRGDPDLYLLGWTGDYPEGYNFIGTFFGRYTKKWGFKNPKLFADLNAVDNEPDVNKRVDMYKALNQEIMDYLPGLPLSSSPPSLAFAKNVTGVKPSPLTAERFADAEFK